MLESATITAKKYRFFFFLISTFPSAPRTLSNFDLTPNVMGPDDETIQPTSSSSDNPSLSLRLPVSKLRPLIKLDPDVQLPSQEAIYLIGKLTEWFIELLATVTEPLKLSFTLFRFG